MVWKFMFGKFVHVKVFFGVNKICEPLEVEEPKNEIFSKIEKLTMSAFITTILLKKNIIHITFQGSSLQHAEGNNL